MRSRNYYRVRTLVRIAFWGGLLIALFVGIDHLNWVGDHYCFHTMTKCYGLDK
jgi:hypothetical protein